MLDWFASLFLPIVHGAPNTHPTMQSIMVLMVVAAVGLAIGRIAIRGISVGIAGVLFSGLLFGHFGMNIDSDVLGFVQEFGLILFVYSIGAQVGPSFFSTLRKQGTSMALVGSCGILIDCVLVILFVKVLGYPIAEAIGVYCGAVTNTPALGAAQQTLSEMTDSATAAIPGLGYAVTYPFGVLGIIMTFILLKLVFRIDIPASKKAYDEAHGRGRKKLQNLDIEIADNVSDEELKKALEESTVTVSRMMTAGEIRLGGDAEDIAEKNPDIIHVVGDAEELKALESKLGHKAGLDLRAMASDIASREIIVTNTPLVGKTIDELKCVDSKSVVVTRVSRAAIEFVPDDDMALAFGDRLRVVGEPEALDAAVKELGNSAQKLDNTQMIPVLLAIAFGVFFGSIGVPVPGLSAPLKLGLAGGVLVAAILFSRINRIGPLVWYMPMGATLVLRELGIVLFLCCVGLKGGGKFVETLTQGPGLSWVGLGALVTVTSLVMVGVFCLKVLKMNYLTAIGFMSGSHTNPPSLAYASGLIASDAAAYGYATFYPLAMLLRVMTAQILVLCLA